MQTTELVYTKDYELKYYEQNINKSLKESALFHFLQDIATQSAESLGFGPSFVFANNFAWVVLRYHIEMHKWPTAIPFITIKTEPRGVTKLWAYRDFEILDPQGKTIGKINSCWSLIDVKTRRILPIQKVCPSMFPFIKKENDLEFDKNHTIENITFSKEFNIRFDDIDINQHVNNSNYIVWALETLPKEFRITHTPKTLDVKYKKEASSNTKIFATTELTENNTCSVHSIKNTQTNEELCSLKINWQTH